MSFLFFYVLDGSWAWESMNDGEVAKVGRSCEWKKKIEQWQYFGFGNQLH